MTTFIPTTPSPTAGADEIRSDSMATTKFNTDPIYAPFEVALSDIYGIYKVLLCMSIK